MSGVTWEVVEAKKAAKVYRSFCIKCRVITCKHYQSYLAIYRDDSDGYSDRCNQARKKCHDLGIEAFYNHFV